MCDMYSIIYVCIIYHTTKLNESVGHPLGDGRCGFRSIASSCRGCVLEYVLTAISWVDFKAWASSYVANRVASSNFTITEVARLLSSAATNIASLVQRAQASYSNLKWLRKKSQVILRIWEGRWELVKGENLGRLVGLGGGFCLGYSLLFSKHFPRSRLNMEKESRCLLWLNKLWYLCGQWHLTNMSRQTEAEV